MVVIDGMNKMVGISIGQDFIKIYRLALKPLSVRYLDSLGGLDSCNILMVVIDGMNKMVGIGIR